MDIERQFERIVNGIGDTEAPREEHRCRLRRQVLDAVESAGSPAPMLYPQKIRTLIMNKSLIRWTTAAAVLLIGVALILMYSGSSPTAAWADVGENLNRAQSFSFHLAIYRNGELRMEGQFSYLQADLMRVESKDWIGVFDWSRGKFLNLFPREKQAFSATVTDIKKYGQREQIRNWLADLKGIIGSKKVKEIGDQVFGDRSCKGWQVDDSRGAVTVWADHKTAEIVRVEIQKGAARTVMSDFNFNPQLEESQFSLKVPQGYEMVAETTFAGKDASEDDLLLLLRAWSGGNGGMFPDSLTDITGWLKAAPKYDWSQEKQDENTMKMALSRALFKLGMQQDWTYRGKGVKRGDAKKAVFWSSVGKDKFRVIYGDLSVRQLSKEELPEK
jgi:hypothetical protein